MNNEETKYKNQKKSISLLIFGILLSIGLIFGIIKIYTIPLKETGFFSLWAVKLEILLLLVMCLLITIAIILGRIIGYLEAQSVINKENKKIKKTNPYIYYRELPNDYGIGVTSLLFDSKIENYKDIISVILDLCARGYLSLTKASDKYYIKVLRNVDYKLLNNEKYILQLIISQKIKEINYDEWYHLCLMDGKGLELFYPNDDHSKNDVPYFVPKWEKRQKFQRIFSIIISLFLALVVFIITSKELNLQERLISAVITYLLTYVIFKKMLSIVLEATHILIDPIIISGSMGRQTAYVKAINNHLTRTNKGVIELQKLISFKKFLYDFGHFVDRSPEEVVLWDRYLSYAQVFGLTKEIMNSGYKQLVKNSSFQIDSIDNITIDNIEVEKNIN